MALFSSDVGHVMRATSTTAPPVAKPTSVGVTSPTFLSWLSTLRASGGVAAGGPDGAVISSATKPKPPAGVMHVGVLTPAYSTVPTRSDVGVAVTVNVPVSRPQASSTATSTEPEPLGSSANGVVTATGVPRAGKLRTKGSTWQALVLHTTAKVSLPVPFKTR